MRIQRTGVFVKGVPVPVLRIQHENIMDTYTEEKDTETYLFSFTDNISYISIRYI